MTSPARRLPLSLSLAALSAALLMAVAGASCGESTIDLSGPTLPGTECVPETCESLKAGCGELADGCGGVLDCGDCGEIDPDACKPITCTDRGFNCGKHADGCGGTIDCGECEPPQTCAGGGLDGKCGCAPATCESLGLQCGQAEDGCGGTVDCGGCVPTPCTPKTCTALNYKCGKAEDGCGGTLDCGSCSSTQTCTGHKCVDNCVPKTCADLKYTCGKAEDGCGGTLDCGSCSSTQTCTGHKCVDNCTPKTCASLGFNCGSASDGCGGTLNCGSCGSNQTCKSNKCVATGCKYTSISPVSEYLLPSASAGKSESKTGTYKGLTVHDEFLYNSDGSIKIGLRREWGGAITWFGLSANPASNAVDGNDTGREVQVAIYDPDRIRQPCAGGATCASTNAKCADSISYMGWNPVQGGNRCEVGSGVTSYTNANGILKITTQPLHWNPDWDRGDCSNSGCGNASLRARKSDVTLEQRIRFINSNTVELQYLITNLSNISHRPYAIQEMPTLYAGNGQNNTPNLLRLMDASGKDIAINESANDGFFKRDFDTAGPWVTLQNANADYGVGILYENGLTSFQGWQNQTTVPFNNVRSRIAFGLNANGAVAARAYLILGGYGTVKSYATSVFNSIPPFGSLDVPAEGATISGSTMNVSGWSLDNKGVTKVVIRIDEGATTQMSYGGSRPDVCAMWPGYPRCSNVGYSGTVNVSGLDKNCKHLVEAIAYDGDGHERVIDRHLISVK